MTPWPYARVFAHRCGGVLAPENTLAGLEVASRYATGVEFDVMLSASGTPVLIHDETLERTTNGSGRVAQTSDARLRELDAGSWRDARFAGERIPTLDEVARQCLVRGLDVNLEIKPSDGQDEVTARVAALSASALWRGAASLPLLSSFSETALRVAAELAPELPRGLLVGAIPLDWHERCRALGAVALHADARTLTREQARGVLDAGWWLVVYTENDPARARMLFDWGVNCIITDHPELVAEG
ncbi:MAG: glycerophosphodiester phosphodiesterase [Rhodocyclales bacterium]|nr:glycerophosphodiester phosphodiesterase [Rhodocyclales bacterium]